MIQYAPMKIKNPCQLLMAILLCQSAGIIGMLTNAESLSVWYTTIQKPSFNPPGWIFGPVWILLYLLMGMSLYLVWQKRAHEKKKIETAVKVFLFQLILNAIWSPLFFSFHSIGGALIDIIALWMSIIATIFLFAKINQKAAWLLAPYILWVTFALILNTSIWILNS